jgi:DNA polymerase I-like protein with 3'-5' exonuclease and polymerase domains
LWDRLSDPEQPTVSHSTYDAKELTAVLAEVGCTVAGPVYDTMVMAWLINENTPLTLEWLAKRYLHITMDKRIRTSAGHPVFRCDDGTEVPLAEAPMDQMKKYNGEDIHEGEALFLHLKNRMVETAWWDFYQREHLPFTRTLIDMMNRGLPVDLEASEAMRVELDAESEALGRELHAVLNLPASFNLNSGPQLSALLFNKVFDLTDSLEWEPEEIECLKSCLAGEHDDCELPEWDGLPDEADRVHIADLLPAGFSIDSVGRTKVHGRWTLRGLGLPGGQLTPAGDRFSTSSPALLTNFDAATHPWVVDLLRYRKMTKVLTTYLRKFPEVAREANQWGQECGPWDGHAHSHRNLLDEWELCTDLKCRPQGARVYGRFNQTGTVTGRLSSSSPNLQNIPAHGELGPRVRRLFRAVEGTQLLVGDYSQLEPRLMAHFSEDPVLVDVYTTGKDIYRTIAAALFGVTEEAVSPEQRGIAKTYVLAMGYGAGSKKLQQILTINGYPMKLGVVERYLNRLHETLWVFFDWREAVIKRARREGYVTTLAGQHRRLSAQFKATTWKARGYGERQAVNAVIQGSAGDIVRRTMMAVDADPGPLRMLAQVHDELVWEYNLADFGMAPIDATFLNTLASVAENNHGFPLAVPLVFEPHTGETWYDAKEGTAFLLPEDFAADGFEDTEAELEEA